MSPPGQRPAAVETQSPQATARHNRDKGYLRAAVGAGRRPAAGHLLRRQPVPPHQGPRDLEGGTFLLEADEAGRV